LWLNDVQIKCIKTDKTLLFKRHATTQYNDVLMAGAFLLLDSSAQQED